MDLVTYHCVRRGHVALAVFADLHEARAYYKALPGNVRRHATLSKALAHPTLIRYEWSDEDIKEMQAKANTINYDRSHKKHLKTCYTCKEGMRM